MAKIIVRHEIVSVRAKGYVSQQSSTQEKLKRKFFPLVETPQRSPRLAVKWLDRLHSRTALLKVCHHFLSLLHYKWCPGTGFSLSRGLVLCGVSVHVFVHVRIQAKNSNRTTVRTFSNFNLLHGRCMLLPFPSALNVIVCSCLHGIPPIIDVRIKLWMNLIWWYVLGPPNHPIKFPSKFFSYMVIC